MLLKKPLNKYIDHTLLRADATPEEILKLCREAAAYRFKAVCVNASYAALASEALEGTGVLTACVVGFPLGAAPTAAKVAETACACRDGAKEIDMVIHLGMLKSGDLVYCTEDIRAVREEADKYGAALKVIVETCLLTEEQKVLACRAAADAGAAFVKTSTGFSTGGATPEDVALMRSVVGDALSVKASGGIRTLDAAMKMIEAGADRLGVSAGVAIMKEYLAGQRA
ncbi:MAG: deoxyribose-phosphate aldolase [Eubacterium sp.]|nr:deoxyribose-phosphate aldolase [Eubacterium sp.]